MLFKNLGKGSLWTVDPQYRPNLLQAMTRSPYHPCSTLEPAAYFCTKARPSQEKLSIGNHRLPNPELFPYLASEMHKIIKTEEVSDDSLDAVDAATVMLSLRNGTTRNTKQKKAWKVITTSPSQDHTYSAAENVNNSTSDTQNNQNERYVRKTERYMKSRLPECVWPFLDKFQELEKTAE